MGGCARAAAVPDLHISFVGVPAAVFQPGMAWGSAAGCRGSAVRLMLQGRVDRLFFPAACRRRERVHGQRFSGCVPGRHAFSVLIYCGSFQSFRAMEVLLAMVCRSSCSGDGQAHGGGWRRRRRRACAKDPRDIDVILFLGRVFCAKWWRQLSLCILLDSACTVLMYLFLN